MCFIPPWHFRNAHVSLTDELGNGEASQHEITFLNGSSVL